MITRQMITDVEPIAPDVWQHAEAAIADLEQSITPGVWLTLDKATLIQEIRDRVRNPYRISQGGQPFCGPAAVVFELARKQPLRYINLCSYLYLIGGFHAKSRYIPVSEQLRRATTGNLRMGQTDWMILSTFRDMENVLFAVEPNAPELLRNLAGMTKPWELVGWIKEILGYQQVDCDYTVLGDDISALQSADRCIRAGGVAFALVCAEGLLTDKPPLIPLPTHWIGIVGNIAIRPDTVQFDCYTWSKKIRLQMDHATCKKYLWAIVTGQP